MKLIVVIVCCLWLTVDSAPANCFEGALQDNIDFKKIAGDWNQVYFTKGSIYGEALCVRAEIYNVSTETSTLEMLTKIVISESPDKQVQSRVSQTILSTAGWSDDVSKSENIKNHIVTDYDTYLIFYYCSLGRQYLDVRVRDNKRLHLRQIREIAEIADSLGSSFFDLQERAEPDCNEYR